MADENGLTLKNRYAFLLNSDPNQIDSEYDGIPDDEDNRPWEKGMYSEEAGDVVIGQLTIVSSLYNNRFAGHTFLIYESYVYDTLDFTGFTGGYILENNNTSYYRTGPCMYDIGPGEIVSMGNTFAAYESPFVIIETDPFNIESAMGNMFNREFIYDVAEPDDEQYYCNNLAHTREITENQMEVVLYIHNNNSYYTLFTNNCAITATYAWNMAFDTLDFTEFSSLEDIPASMIEVSHPGLQLYESTPLAVYNTLDEMGVDELDIRKLLKIK